MWRALAYLVLLAVAAFGAVWIADRPGTVTVVWNGYQIGTSLPSPSSASSSPRSPSASSGRSSAA